MFFSRDSPIGGIITLLLAFINNRRNPRRPPTPPTSVRIRTRLGFRNCNGNLHFPSDEQPLPGIPLPNPHNLTRGYIFIPAAPQVLPELALPPQVHPPANGGSDLQEGPGQFGWEYWESYGTEQS
ncbi:hypothetical protein L873DRAFT_1840631 [Choiromyces venosus 120613-1]|uniref:Uncharacterized protein n=1 Tax=Choiromyces venosus 120613-1 TaxID=1336337 RepID=A0A3N4K0K8_9PEZI|nr:hypothetical protein L873DRAFT_1840631 [Choiromyces venosus 120613-1]